MSARVSPKTKKRMPMMNEMQPFSPGGAEVQASPDAPSWLPGLWPLLERQALLYTGGDSTSLPYEMIQRLLESVLFCIKTATAAGEAGDDPAALLLAGQRLLWKEVERGKALHRALCRGGAQPRSEILKETLDGIGHFFKWYDLRFFAHENPAMIDYPLCVPVDEGLLGIEFIVDYLQRMTWESRFQRCFPPKQVEALLNAHRPGWKELPYNLCEPLFGAALGKALRQGGTPHTAALLHREAAKICNGLRLWDTGLRGYFATYAKTLQPILASADEEGLSKLFPSWQ